MAGEVLRSVEGTDPAPIQDMEVEVESETDGSAADAGGGGSADGAEKREREEEADGTVVEGGGVSKKQKAEKSMEEERLEKLEEEEEKKGADGGGDGGNEACKVSLGPKEFGSSEEMFNYFFKLLHFWPTDHDINKYEYMVLLDLLKKGHTGLDKIREGIKAFQVQYHPTWKSRCFYVVRVDGTSDDFSFRKCVDQIHPLPDNLKVRSASDGKGDGRSWGGGRGRRGRGRRGRV